MPTFCIRNGNGILCFVLFYDIMFCSVIYKYISFFSWLLYNSICMIKYSLYSEKTFFPYHQYLKPFSISLECESYQWSSELCLSKGGAVVRALASDHGGPGSNLGIDITCGLSFLLVLNFGPRGLFSGDLVFPSQKPPFSNSSWTRNGRQRVTTLMCFF